MKLRQAHAEDLPAIGRLGYDNWMEAYRALVDPAFLATLSPESRSQYYAHYLTEAGGGILAAVDEADTLVGFAAFTPDGELPDCTLLDSLHVEKNARGQGIGTALINAILNLAAGSGDSKVSVCAVKGNERARVLYVRRGAEHYDYHVSKAFGDCEVISEKLIWRF